jgi:hypothetical protein
LLPDGEEFVLFVRYLHKKSGTAKLKRQQTRLTVEQAVELVERGGSSRLVKSKATGYLVAAGRHFIKADGKKAKRFADCCGPRFKKRSKATR